MELKIETGEANRSLSLPDLRRALKGFESQIPIATAQSITFTAERVQQDLSTAMQRAFDSPTRSTLNSVRKTSATPRRLFAEVKLKDYFPQGTAPSRYLQPQIRGGFRGQKGVGRNLRNRGLITGNQYMVPGDDVRLNRFGNITKGQVVKALSNISAQRDALQNTTSKAAKSRQKKTGRQYFWLPGAGIYWRQGKRSLRSFMVITKRPRYQKRFDFYGISQKSIERHLPEQISRSIDRSIRKMAEKGGAS